MLYRPIHTCPWRVYYQGSGLVRGDLLLRRPATQQLRALRQGKVQGELLLRRPAIQTTVLPPFGKK